VGDLVIIRGVDIIPSMYFSCGMEQHRKNYGYLDYPGKIQAKISLK
jgi:hypothetical protein